jgi:hypothetical protein
MVSSLIFRSLIHFELILIHGDKDKHGSSFSFLKADIQFSQQHLLVYSKTTEFCKLTWYPDTLLKLFMVSRRFWVEFFWSFRNKIMSSVNRDSLTTSLLFLFLLFFLLALLLWLGIQD